MAIDPRLELARRIAAGGTPTQKKRSSLQQRAAARAAELQSMQTQTAGSGDGGGGRPGGWKGLLAGAFDNPVTKVLTKPLEVLDFGRANLVSGLKEISDAVDFNENTKASWNEFQSQVDDRIGFGDVIAMNGGLGNKWLDRIAGFVGDVGLDPLTYVTLGGSAVAGVAGRTALSADIARQGMKNVTKGAITSEALEDTLRRAGKYGLGKLTKEERVLYNLPQAGFRFMGKRVGGEALAQKVGSGLSSTRAGITGYKPVQRVLTTKKGYFRSAPENFEEAITKLATGKGNISATQAATFVASMNTKAAVGGAFAGTWGRVGNEVLSGLDNNEARNLTYALEAGDLSSPAAQAARKIEDDVVEAFKVATGKELPYRPNHVAHIWSNFGRKFLSSNSKVAEDLRKIINITVDLVDSTAFAKQRKIDAGTYNIAGKKVTFRQGTIADINDTLRRAFPDQIVDDVLETDYRRIYTSYIKGVGEGVGNEALLKELQNMGTAINKEQAFKLQEDVAGTKAANKAAAEEYKEILQSSDKALKRAQSDAVLSLREAVKGIGDVLKTKVAGLTKTSVILQNKFDELAEKLFSDTLSLDAKISEINVEVLDIKRAVDDARASYDSAIKAVKKDIAEIGTNYQTMRKDRLSRRRALVAEVNESRDRLAELEVHFNAYKELEDTAVKLRAKIDETVRAESPDIDNLLTDEMRKTLGKRTVAEQRELEGYGMGEGLQVRNVPVKVGEEVETAFSRRLVADDKAAGSLYRNTMGSVEDLLDEDTLYQLERVRNLVDGLFISSKRYTEQQLQKATNDARKLADQLNAAKKELDDVLNRRAQGLGSVRDENTGLWIAGTSTSQARINTLQNRVDLLQTQVENAMGVVNDIADEIGKVANVRSDFLVEPEPLPRSVERFVRDPKEPGGIVEQARRTAESGARSVKTGTAREQAQKQLEATAKRVSNDAAQRVLAQTGSEAAARDYGELVYRTIKAMEARARAASSAEANKFSSAAQRAYVVSSQMKLQEALKRSRISLDYSRRLRLLKADLDAAGRQLSAEELEALENVVMENVLKTEIKNLRARRDTAIDNIQKYTENFNELESQNIKKTAAYNTAVDEAVKTWGFINVYLDELMSFMRGEATTDLMDPTGIAGVGRTIDNLATEEGANIGFTVSEGAGTSRINRSRRFKELSIEAEKDIANILFPGNTKKIQEFIASGQIRKFLSEVTGRREVGEAAWQTSSKLEKTWIDFIVKIRMQEFNQLNPALKASTRGQRSYGLAETAARGQIDEFESEIRMLEKTISKLRPQKKSYGPKSDKVKSTVARLLSGAEELRDRAARLTGDEIEDVGFIEQRTRLLVDAQTMEDAANFHADFGILPRGSRLSAQDVLNWEYSPLRYGISSQSKKLADLNAQLFDVESRMQDIVSGGKLANAVKDVPGRRTIQNKAKAYIAAIDDELKKLRDRKKRLEKGKRGDVSSYERQLVAEREKLVKALDQSTPLEDRVLTAKQILAEKKKNLSDVAKATDQEMELAASLAQLKERLRYLKSPEGVYNEVDSVEATLRAGFESRVAVLREAHDATVTATRNAEEALNASRSQIESFIPAVEEILRRTPKVPKRAGADQIDEVFEWIRESYELLDPEGLAARRELLPQDMIPEAIADTTKLYGSGVKASDLVDYLSKFPDDQDARIALSLIYRAHEDAGKLMVIAGDRSPLEEIIKSAKANEFVVSLKYALRDGFEQIAETGVYVPAEMQNMFQRVLQIDNRDVAELLKALNKYTEIWKAVKTTSPRFHIRNALSATVMNFVAGVSPSNMVRGTQYYKAFLDNPRGWLNTIPEEYRPFAKQALDVVFAAGGGQYQEVANAATGLSQRGIFRLSRDVGSNVEGFVRMGQALDAVLPVELGGKGFGFDTALGAVEKFHFNYSKLSQFDRNAKALIPFWTFMSRNLPLQLEQMWLSPRTYAIYNSLARNLNATEEGDIVPSWIQEGDGFKLPFGENLYAVPDIGYTQVQRDLKMLQDPMRLAQNLNPLPKTALEWWAGKQFYQDIPLDSDQYVELRGASKLLQPLLALTGGTESFGGKTFGTERDVYGLTNIIPGLSELERYIAPSTERSSERQGQNIFSFLTGAPVTRVTERQINAERLRREFQGKDDKAKQKALRRALRENR